MSLCINPRCLEPDHPGNDSSRFCQSCGSDLVLQDRYRVLRLLSDKSGFGRVYETYERSTPKILKVLKETYNNNEKAVELFQQEAQVLSQLCHSGIPRIEPHGYFQFVPKNSVGVLHCIIMEKIDGPNLREWMKQQGHHPIGGKQALNWLQQIAEILHLVHQKNYFHRDIKPENIMLRSNGQLVLVDFGAAREMTYTYLAQLSGGSSGVTRISSAGYTPPEQEYGQAVPQSDFYALGRTLIYLLTAKLPTDSSIYDPVHNEFHWRDYAPGVSPPLADFIDKLVAPRASDRPKNTQEILDMSAKLTLEASQEQSYVPISKSTATSTLIRPDTIAQSAPTPSKGVSFKNKWLWGGATALIIGFGGYGIWQVYQSTKPVAAIEQVAVIRTLTGHDSNVNALAIGPGGQDLISGSSDGTVKVWNFQTGQLMLNLEGHRSFINAVTVSPDGQVIISGSADKTLKVWDFQTGKLLHTLQGHTSYVNTLVVSHSGQTIISGSADGDIKFWDFQTGKERNNSARHAGGVNVLFMSRDGQTVISGGADGSIKVWDAITGEERSSFPAHSGPVNTMLLSLDGRSLISGSADNTIKVWDVSSHQELHGLTGHSSSVNVLQIGDDGHTLFSGSADKTVRVWNIASGKLAGTLTGFDTHVNELVIGSDGRAIATNSGNRDIKIWQIPEEELGLRIK